MSDIPLPQRRLILPPLGRLYRRLIDYTELLLRATAGLALVIHGAGKIVDPLGNIELVQSLGFYPGVLWSPLLAITEFFGGILVAIGLLTRPASLAAAFVLLVAAWFHWFSLGEGYTGAEKALLWAVIMLHFAVRGGNRLSVDARLGREF